MISSMDCILTEPEIDNVMEETLGADLLLRYGDSSFTS